LGDVSSVIDGDKNYLFARLDSNKVITCTGVKTGQLIWVNLFLASAITGSASSQHSVPKSTPVVGGGKIVTSGVGIPISLSLKTDVSKISEAKSALSFFK